MEINEELCLLASVRELYRPGVTDMHVLLATELEKVVAHAKDTAMARILPCRFDQITVETAKAFFHSHGIPIVSEEDRKVVGRAGPLDREIEPSSKPETVAENRTEGVETRTETRIETESDIRTGTATELGALQEEPTKKIRTGRVGRPRRTSSIPSVGDDGAHVLAATGKRPIVDVGAETALPPEDSSSPATTIESSPIKRPRRSTRK